MGNTCCGNQGQEKNDQITSNPQPIIEEDPNTEIGHHETKAREQYVLNQKVFDNQRETNREPTDKSFTEDHHQSQKIESKPTSSGPPQTTSISNTHIPSGQTSLTNMPSVSANALATVAQVPATNPHSPTEQVAWPIKEIPNFLNEKGKKTLLEQGEFIYDEDEPGDSDLPKLGPFQFDNSSVYVGQWKNGQRHARGTQYWSDGSVYEGYWRNNMAQGKGRLIHSDGDVFIGRWKEDKANGRGRYLHMDGAVYEGDWQDDKQHGKGVEEWPDGARYEGDYVDGKKHGTGKFHWADGSTYEGQFNKNNIHGKGCYDWSDGRKYDGEWRNNKMEGRGVFTWSDGRKYEGEYKDDKKHGYGVFEWPDNRTYKGNWANGRQHGKGVYIGSQGVEKEGEWSEGKRVKWIQKGSDQAD